MGEVINPKDVIWDETPEKGSLPAAYGGKDASIGAGESESKWEHFRTALSEALFGGPGRAEAKAAGIGLQPTPAELVQGAGMIAAPIGAPAAMGAAASGAARVLPMVPRAISAYQGGQQGYKAAGPVGAVAGAAMGAAAPATTGVLS